VEGGWGSETLKNRICPWGINFERPFIDVLAECALEVHVNFEQTFRYTIVSVACCLCFTSFTAFAAGISGPYAMKWIRQADAFLKVLKSSKARKEFRTVIDMFKNICTVLMMQHKASRKEIKGFGRLCQKLGEAINDFWPETEFSKKKYLHDLKHANAVLKSWGNFGAGSTQPIESENAVAKLVKQQRIFRGSRGQGTCAIKIIERLLRANLPEISSMLAKAQKTRAYNCSVCGEPGRRSDHEECAKSWKRSQEGGYGL